MQEDGVDRDEGVERGNGLPLTSARLLEKLSSVRVVSVPLHASGRAHSHSALYFRMCCEALVTYRQLQTTGGLSNLLDPDFIDKVEQVQMAAIKPIVFAGMCLEATLFDLSACLYGDAFAASIERLDPLGKFVVLVQCVDRETPSTSHVAYQHIKDLIAARNQLVHHKSKRLPQAGLDGFMEAAEKNQDLLKRATNQSFKALVHLSLYFDGNIFEELRILPSFKRPEYWKDLIPPSLHADVHDCIGAARRASSRRKSLTDTGIEGEGGADH